MDAAGIEMREIGNGCVRADLSVHPVTRFQDDFVALLDLEERRDVGVIAVVAAMLLGRERLRPVDANSVFVHGRGSWGNENAYQRPSIRTERGLSKAKPTHNPVARK